MQQGRTQEAAVDYGEEGGVGGVQDTERWGGTRIEASAADIYHDVMRAWCKELWYNANQFERRVVGGCMVFSGTAYSSFSVSLKCRHTARKREQPADNHMPSCELVGYT